MTGKLRIALLGVLLSLTLASRADTLAFYVQGYVIDSFWYDPIRNQEVVVTTVPDPTTTDPVQVESGYSDSTGFYYIPLSLIHTPGSALQLIVRTYDCNHKPHESVFYYTCCVAGYQADFSICYDPEQLTGNGQENPVAPPVYPNPGKNELIVEKREWEKVSLYSSDGNLVRKWNSNYGNCLDVSFLSPGIYYYTVTFPQGRSLSGKWIKSAQ